jgi:class 3 adenylate cyclase
VAAGEAWGGSLVQAVAEPQSRGSPAVPEDGAGRCRSFCDGLLTGLVLSLASYNLVLFVFIRDRTHLLFALYGILAALYALSVQEYLSELIWPSWPRWDSIFSWILVMVTVQVFVRFTQRFLNTAETIPGGHRWLNLLMGLLVVGPFLGAPVVGLDWRREGFLWNTSLALIVFVSVIVLARICQHRGYAPARAYLAGNTFFCVGGFCYGLSVLDLVPGRIWLRDLAQVGIAFQVGFFSLGIADRVARLRRRLARQEIEKARFEQELVAAQNRELELRVARRTAELQRKQEETERLLYNILPREVARELRRYGQTTPCRHDEVSILFGDFVGFTVTVGTIPPQKLVGELNAIFGAFDDIVEHHGLEKIKTIGDAYQAVAGLPQARSDHAGACVRAALEMAAFVEVRNQASAIKWRIRLGIHSGTVVAGVVGKRKFAYDIWGDAVNIAARMEAAAHAGRVNLSAYTYDLVREHFECEYRGKIEVKGKGRIDMYHVIGEYGSGRPKAPGLAGPGGDPAACQERSQP